MAVMGFIVFGVVVLLIGYGISACIRLLGRSVGQGIGAASGRGDNKMARLEADLARLQARVDDLERSQARVSESGSAS
jgi:hypothetical protein